MDRTVWSAGAAMAVAALGTSIANVALPQVAADFGLRVAAAQWVVVGYLITVAVLVTGAGRLGDRMGHRRVLIGGVSLFTAGAALGAVAPTAGWLVAARVMQGAGAAAMMALPVALLRGSLSADRMGHAMGMAGTLSAVGTAIGPAAGGLLVAMAGWRAVFVVMALAGLLVLASLLREKAPPAAPQAGPGDPAGTVLLASAVSAWALAMTLGGGRGGPRGLVVAGRASCGGTPVAL